MLRTASDIASEKALLFTPSGRPVSFAERPETGEAVAVFSQYQYRWGEKMRAYNPDDLIRDKAKGLKLYQEMTREPYIRGALLQIKAAVLSVPWRISAPTEKSPNSEAATAFVNWCMKSFFAGGSFTRDIYESLDALNVGFSIAEQVYEYIETGNWKGKVGLRKLKHKDPAYIEFAPDEYGNLGAGSVLVTLTADGQSYVPFDASKFFIFSFDKLYENHYGQALLRSVYRAYWIKNTAWRLRAVYMERYSGNNLKAKIPRGKWDKKGADGVSEKDAMKALLASWAQETGIVIPDDVEVDVINLATSSVSEYQLAIEACNKEIQIGIIGQTLTMDEGKKSGARAMGQVHADVAATFAQFIDLYMTADINEQVIQPLVKMNFGEMDEYPSFGFGNRSKGTKEDAETIKTLVEAGLDDISKAQVHENFRLEVAKDDSDRLKMPVPAPAPSPTEPVKLSEGELFHGEPHTSDAVLLADPAPSKFVKISKPDDIGARLDALVVRAKEKSRVVYDKIKTSIAAQCEKVFANDKPDYIAASKVKVTDIGGLKEIFANTILTAKLQGMADVTDELVKQGWEKPAVKFAEEDLYTPEEAMAAFSGRVPMSKAEFLELENMAADEAFYVAGLEKTRIEAEIKPLLEQGIKNGWGYKTFKYELDQLFIKYSTPVYGREGTVGQAILDYHAETVFRTNVMDAYNKGRRSVMEEATDFAPAWEYSAILDSRTRPTHAAMNGKIFLMTDPIWAVWYPPNGYNCRCYVVPVNKYDLTPEMLSKAPAERPDTGFGG